MSSETNSSDSRNRLALPALTALVIGSMIGGGIFSLPQNVAASAGVGATLIGWLITGVGMLTLALVFQNLANRRPDLDGGIYAYAREGFGNYMGFSSAWGYWISAWIGNVSYFVLLFSSLGYFFPIFGDGNTPASILCASLLLWIVHFLVLSGIRQAAFINQLATWAKIVPLLLFIILVITAFHWDVFSRDFIGNSSPDAGSLLDQVRGMMLVTVWVFIGIEGASVYSGRARKRRDVGRATVIGFLVTLVLLLAINLLSMGVMSQAELAGLKNPSMAGVLSRVIGPWGSVLINIGLIISLAGALLAWVLLSAEILSAAARDRTMPAFLARENRNEVPANALWLSNGMIQLFLVLTLFSESTYLSLLYLATSMILVPYFWSAAYAVLFAWRGNKDTRQAGVKGHELVIAVVALLYSIWLIYAGGLQYLLLSAVLYAPGALLFARARREQGKPVFVGFEKPLFAVVLLAGLFGVYGLYAGFLSL
ncbi:arginine-ornithine antiporter [Kushneria phosphatilytica]|uniref:Arginine-ornithine antiporter n=1 Tax=Kushneria phosphatilytica TaxID=657387 RepID=A0A1S1NTB2_9GAMM|nr:arginine-ornithine antiporter [Kushneria phosphatilytica]OHV10020.1 arginine-ornithine antiporter [Kushneria phosphatilytica]QEL11704.1 arginine-ornithine antiporter [Kushneria phosphatilytica]